MKLFTEIRFDRKMNEQTCLPTIGGFEVELKDGRVFEFDFKDSEAWVSDEDNMSVCYSLRNPDRSAFPDVDELIKNLHKINRITDFYVDTECYDNGFAPHPVEVMLFQIDGPVADKSIPKKRNTMDIIRLSEDISMYIFSKEFCKSIVF